MFEFAIKVLEGKIKQIEKDIEYTLQYHDNKNIDEKLTHISELYKAIEILKKQPTEF